ncbi:CYTH domain-containing protein [Myroides sp. LJL116]
MREIERKFLVKDDSFISQALRKNHIMQGYLNSDPERTVRVRVKNTLGYLTIKGKSDSSGTTRFEWENQIPLQEAQALMLLCEDYIIDKTRYEVKYGNHTFEVDVFHGDNEGLIIAEVELNDAQESFEKPLWLAQEVTGQVQYYNSYIAKKPYSTWK